MKTNKDHWFRPNHNLNMQDNFFFFDTETHIKKDWRYQEQTLKLGWAIHWRRSTKEKHYLYFEDARKLYDFIEAYTNHNEPSYVFAHNMDFDFKVSNGFEEMVIARGYESDIIYMQQNVFMLVLKRFKKTINFLDTMNYTAQPLKKVGQCVGLPKTDIDFETCTKAELSAYCRNDVDIIQLYIERLLDFLETNDLSKLKNTASSLAFNTFRHKFYDFKNCPIKIHAWPGAVKLERDSYRGGITDCFRVGTYNETLYKLDFNSMYPAVLYDEKIPRQCLEYYQYGCKVEDLPKLRKRGELIIKADIELSEEHAYILTHDKVNGEEKCLFMQGRFTETLCQPEIDYVLKYGKIHAVHEYAIYDTAPVFRSYVKFFYDKRLEFKAKGDLVNEQFCKQMMVSLYGKTAQRQTSYEHIGYCEEPEVAKFQHLEDLSEDGQPQKIEEYTLTVCGHKVYKVKESQDNSYDSFVAMASFVTSHARMRLVYAIMKAGRKNVFYCDTDSLIVNKEGLDGLKDMIDQNKLGYLKLEGTGNVNAFIRPKFYIFDNKETCKGVKKSSVRLFDGKTELIILSDQFERMNSALRNGTSNMQRVKKVNKVLSKIYDKGQVTDDGFVIPYTKAALMKVFDAKASYLREMRCYHKLNDMLDVEAWTDSSLEKGENVKTLREIY